jgi:predicted Zn-dependent protease
MQLELKRVSIAVYILIVSLLSGCVTIYNPATQRKEIYLIDTKSEVALGNDMDQQVQQKFKILNDPQMQMRLNSIGEKLAYASDRKDLAYHFKIVQDKELNAFAIPGGYVYVNSALMNIATDDELAGVLAHEIGHIAARHSVKKLQAALGYQIILGIALGLSGQGYMGQAMNIVFDLATLGYSRNDELLADKLSVKYTRIAGFDPRGIITFFEKLKQEEKAHPNYTPLFLRSHPYMDERINQIKKEIEASQ